MGDGYPTADRPIRATAAYATAPGERRRTVTTTPPTARRQAGLPPQRSSRPVAAASSADRCPLDTPTEDDRLDE